MFHLLKLCSTSLLLCKAFRPKPYGLPGEIFGVLLNKYHMAPQDESLANSNGLQRFDNIVKSTYDKREYRGLVLPNEMKVLLVSDSTTEKSAAAINVRVGYMSDPDELAGLAHFCEHMLFLGTKKYPGENDYQKFLAEHGGSFNAHTDAQETKYFFDVAPEHLLEILDIFSQFFISPLFTESATEREINAVDSEHLKNIPNDMWRNDYIDKFLCNPKHPYHKFGTGNKDTLMETPKQKGINVREALLKFHNEWYSSNIMTLAILGKEPLDDLEKMAKDFFGPVDNKKVKVPIWPEHPYTSEHFATSTYITPIKDIRLLSITFPVQDLEPHFKSAPGHYLGHLFGHEGPGSLLSALKARGWSSSLSCGSIEKRGFCFFRMDADLTEDGVEHIDNIIKLVFQYVNLLKKEGPQKWIFDESGAINELNFRFKDKEMPRHYVLRLVNNLMYFSFEDVLRGPSIMSDWNPDLITSILEEFIPEKARVNVVSKKYESKCTELEPIYGTKYHREKFSDETLDTFKNADYCQDLKLPPPNEFIPTDFSLQQLQNVTVHPTIILDTAQLRVWYKQDDEFLLPKLNICMRITTPLAYLDPLSCNLTHMFVNLFQDSLNEYAYAAELAGLAWSVGVFNQGVMISIGGYDNKLSVLLQKILGNMKEFKIDEKRFEIFRENYIRHLKNFEIEQPYQHAMYYLGVILTEHCWTKEELLHATQHTTVENLKVFLPQLFSKLHIENIFHGNCNKTQALDLANLIEKSLNLNERPPLFAQQLINNREHKLEPCARYKFDVDHLYHKSSCTEVFYQCGLQGTETNMLLELLTQIIHEPCFNTLRTKEQLGYIVSCSIRRSNGTQGLRIIVQSERPPPYVDHRIEEFINTMRTHLQNISLEEFNRHKEALAVQRLEKPKTLAGLTHQFWNEISNQQYHFSRANVEVAHLRSITKEQLLSFFMDQIEIAGANRKKLAVYVRSKLTCGDQDKQTVDHPAQSYNVITNLLSFKNSKELFPLVAPYINIPNKGAQSKL